MNTKVMMSAAIAAVLGVSAVWAEVKAPQTDEEKAARREKMMKATGGILDIAPKGKVVVINAQEKVPAAAVQAKVESLAKELRMNVEVANGKDWKMYTVPAGAVGAVVIADAADLPMSVVAAEKTWGLMNVAPIVVAGDEERTVKRFNREFVRVACFTFGQSHSQYRGAPLSTVKGVEDLDGITNENLTFESVTMVMRTLMNLGMTQSRKTSYKKACQEGWAPAPTNTYQKAIWERIKAEQSEAPTKGIKIKFDKNKQGAAKEGAKD
jgi:hypothetical protein